jgi:nitrite reductase (NO-forming)
MRDALHASTRPQHSSTEGDGLAQRVRANCRPKDAFRIAFGLIWAIDALLKWEPAFRSGFTGDLKMAAEGQPGWLHGWFHLWINLVAPNSGFFAYSTAVIETLVAAAVIFGFARKFTYIGAALFSVLIWATAEGFGGPYSSSSTDIGTAVMYAVVFMGLLALDYETSPSRFSVDTLIERRVSWWHRIAEIGPSSKSKKPVTTTPVPVAPKPVASAPVAT